MKKSEFLTTENLRLILIAIILAALILLIPFYIKAEGIGRIDHSLKKNITINGITTGSVTNKSSYINHSINK
jgi:catabolite regulation protein CreA